MTSDRKWGSTDPKWQVELRRPQGGWARVGQFSSFEAAVSVARRTAMQKGIETRMVRV